jgi:hypothetical protein
MTLSTHTSIYDDSTRRSLGGDHNTWRTNIIPMLGVLGMTAAMVEAEYSWIVPESVDELSQTALELSDMSKSWVDGMETITKLTVGNVWGSVFRSMSDTSTSLT